MDKSYIKNTEQEIEFGEPSTGLKKYMAEMELRRKNAHFGKIPHWIVDSGVLAILRPSGTKVLKVLIRYADFVTLIGRVGNKKISKKSGVKGVSTYFKDLVILGIIKTWRKGWTRYYQIQLSPPPDIQKRIEGYRKLYKLDKYPKKTDTYSRDPGTGRFVKKDKLPKTSDIAHPKKLEPA